MTASASRREGLKVARLLMVLSSISPLFILWAIRGTSLLPNWYFVGFCGLMVLIPNAFLWLRIHIARKRSDKKPIVVGTADDHRSHLLVYLFAMLLPFYAQDISTWRDLSATVAALVFIVFLFWHLNLHYMNVIFAILGLRVFTVYPHADGNQVSGTAPLVLITRRKALASGESVIAYRLSDTVYMESGA